MKLWEAPEVVAAVLVMGVKKVIEFVWRCPPKNGKHIVRVVLMMAMMWWLCGYDVLGLCGNCGGGVGDGYDEGDKCLDVNLELPASEPVNKTKKKKSTRRNAEFWSNGC